jgi:hypothetical protein
MMSHTPFSLSQVNYNNSNSSSDLSRYVFIKQYDMTVTAKGIRVPFSVPIDKSTITGQSVFLLDSKGNKVKASTEISPDRKYMDIQFDPSVSLQVGQQYSLYIDNTIKGLNGNTLTNPSKYNINVVKAPINDLPKDVTKYQEKFKPILNVAAQQTFSIQFTTAINPKTVNNNTVFVLDENNQKVDMGITLALDNKTLLIKPTGSYVSGKNYVLYIDNAVTSASGTPLKNAVKMSFTTK